MNDFRLERTAGHPRPTALRAVSSGRFSCVTVSLTMLSYGSMSKVTCDGSIERSLGSSHVVTSRRGGLLSSTFPQVSEILEPSVRTWSHREPTCQSDSLRCPQ